MSIYLPDPDVSILIKAAFSFSFFLTTSIHLFLHVLFRNLIGLLPTYRPEKINFLISFVKFDLFVHIRPTVNETKLKNILLFIQYSAECFVRKWNVKT
jgi:hypothetical protein